MDAFLDPTVMEKMKPLIMSRTSDTAEQLKIYIAEVLRTRPIIGGTYRQAKKALDAPEVGNLAENDRVYISYTEAELDVSAFMGTRLRPSYLMSCFE